MIYLLLMSLFSFSSDIAPESFLESLRSITGLKEGTYVLSGEAPLDCWEGDLRIVDVDKEVSVILGAKALLSGLSPKVKSFTENNCSLTYSNSFKKNHIEEVRKRECKTGTTEVRTLVSLKKHKLTYRRSIFFNGEQTKTFQCVLSKK